MTTAQLHRLLDEMEAMKALIVKLPRDEGGPLANHLLNMVDIILADAPRTSEVNR